MKFWQTYRYDFNANLKLAWPIILGQLGQVSVNIIDNLMVGQLGATALAAVSLGVSVFVVF
ncbi:MAG: MATE family efflux transporter, partial [Bacteroidetes bacterium]|nr:MATE family efflux transporter [Bacteroidota bacterium]